MRNLNNNNNPLNVMKHPIRNVSRNLFGGLLGLSLITSAAADNLVQVLSGRPEFSTLVTAVSKAGLAETLASTDNVTVFAPSNDAFAKVPEEVLNGLLADKQALTNLLLYHVAPTRVSYRNLESGPLETLLPGESVEVDVKSYFRGFFKIVKIDDSRIVRANIRADNGIIHQIDSVLDPEFSATPTILGIAAGNPDFSILAGLVDAAGFAPILDSEHVELTVFAPTNAAFEALGQDTLAAVAADRDLLRSILKNHIAAGSLDSGELSQAGEVRSALGRHLPIGPDPSAATGLGVDGQPIEAADIQASNGIVHVVGGVLLPDPPKSLVGVAVEREDLTTFVTAVGLAGLAPTFDSTKRYPTYTIFAPNNAAFAALPEGLLDSLLADPTGALAEVLKLHVVSGRLMAENLHDGQILDSLSGGRLKVAIDGGEVRINGALVAETDLKAENGVIHVMADVIGGAPYTIADFVGSQPYLSTLLAALDEAGLVGAVSDEDADLTVFAPVNSAFDQLPEGTLETLLSDPAGDLTQILLYHVVAGSLSSAELVAAGSATTLQGADVKVSSKRLRFWFWSTPFNIVRINGQRVISADIQTDNGTVHLLGGVLLPPSGE